MTIPPIPEGIFKNGVVINLFFNFSNIDSHSLNHTYFSLFLVSLVNVVAILEKYCTNLRWYLTKHLISVVDFRTGQFFSTWILLGSTEIPSLEITWPKNAMLSNQNSHLLSLAWSCFCRGVLIESEHVHRKYKISELYNRSASYQYYRDSKWLCGLWSTRRE